jgi:hypothetical protein
MALVLLMEGINQMFVWSHIVEDLDTQINKLLNIPDSDTSEQFWGAVNGTVEYVFNTFPSDEKTYLEVEDALDLLSSDASATDNQIESAVAQLMTGLGEVIFEGFGWEAPETEAESEVSGNFDEIIGNFYQQYLNVFSISFGESSISFMNIVFGMSFVNVMGINSIFLHLCRCSANWDRHFHIPILQGRCAPSSPLHSILRRHHHASRGSRFDAIKYGRLDRRLAGVG